MPYIMTILKVGGQLLVPVPRALLRELKWSARGRVVVTRDGGKSIKVEELEDWTRERADRTSRPTK